MNFALERLRQIRARVTEAGQEPAPSALPSTVGVGSVREARGVDADPIAGPFTGSCIEPIKLVAQEARWIGGEALHGLPKELQGLVCSRDGWVPEAWRDYLKERARRCDSQHCSITLLYLRAADLIDAHATVRRNCI